MSRSAESVLVFGIYLPGFGLAVMPVPNFLRGLRGVPSAGDCTF